MNDNKRYLGALKVGEDTGNRIFVGWLAANPTEDQDFQTYSKNLAEYMSYEMHMAGFKHQGYSDTPLELLNRAASADMTFCLINQIGYWSSQFNHEITNYLNKYYSGESIVGDYESFGGITLVNIDWWVQAGRPDPESTEFSTLAHQASVSSWPEGLIAVVDMDPDLDNHDSIMERMHRTVLNTDVFFCANTEDRDITPDRNSALVTDLIVTVAGGLSAVLMAYTNNMPAGSSIQVIDTSPLAIAMSKKIFQEWDGTNYMEFVHQLMEQNLDRYDDFRGVRNLPLIEQLLSELPDFVPWFRDVFSTYDISYATVDLMNYDQTAKLLDSIDISKHRQVVINFSNVYHYVPSSFYNNHNNRRSLAIRVMSKVGDLSVGGNTKIKLLMKVPEGVSKLLSMFPWRNNT